MSIAREGRICSFCATPGGPGTDVPLVGGLGAQICRSCVDTFHGILHDEERMAAARGVMPWDRMSDAEVLAALPQILASAEQNISFAQEWVEMLHDRGITWAEIGRVLGVTRQAAWERFAKKSASKGATA
ncbi:ClpX C4-type zinc finger protein [Nocardioides sp.]|uniref:ClpX C4-type zinc finger protein n=1 Tax=Nocardioides sp. TaxID=35761 RepID=UPI0035B0A0DB